MKEQPRVDWSVKTVSVQLPVSEELRGKTNSYGGELIFSFLLQQKKKN